MPPGLDEFINSAPDALQGSITEFLQGEGIDSIASLVDALSSSGADGPPLLLERARAHLITGGYCFLRAACKQLGGLPEPAPALKPTARPPPPSPVAFDCAGDELHLPDYKRLRLLLEQAAFGTPVATALPSKSLLDSCDIAAAEKGPVPVKSLDKAPGDRPLAHAIQERIRAREP